MFNSILKCLKVKKFTQDGSNMHKEIFAQSVTQIQNLRPARYILAKIILFKNNAYKNFCGKNLQLGS